eukprot:gene61342-81773_t
MTTASTPLSPQNKWSVGEVTVPAILVVFALACILGWARAADQAFAFHMILFTLFSAIGAFFIVNRAMDRKGGLPPQEIDGRPNYDMGPVKFAALAALFWGVAGFLIGDIIAWQLAFPALNFD